MLAYLLSFWTSETNSALKNYKDKIVLLIITYLILTTLNMTM